MDKTHIGLFEGIGGFSLAAHWAGYTTVAWCEWDKNCQQVLKYWFPNAEAFGDINESDFSNYENKVDLLTAGFPCQLVSFAGARKGEKDERWGWPQTRQVIEQVKPKWVILENVAGLLSILEQSSKVIMETKKVELFGESYSSTTVLQRKRILGTIIAELQESGYILPQLTDGTPVVLCIPACAVNAPHRRDRVWIVAYSKHNRTRSTRNSSQNERHEFATLYEARKGRSAIFSDRLCNLQKSTPDPDGKFGRQQLQFCRSYGAWSWQKFSRSFEAFTADPNGLNKKQFQQEVGRVRPKFTNKCQNYVFARSGKYRSGILESPSDFRRFPTESPVLGRNDGLPEKLVGITLSGHRNFSIKSYGNAIVPELALELIQIINQVENHVKN